MGSEDGLPPPSYSLQLRTPNKENLKDFGNWKEASDTWH